MEDKPAASLSIAQNQSVPVQAHPPASPAASNTRPRSIDLLRVLRIVCIGVVVSVGITLALRYAPYTRVSMLDQPLSANIRIASARLQKGGFIALYLEDPKGGTYFGGASQYLPAGYYAPLYIQVALWAVETGENRHVIARVIQDDGDMVLNEEKDHFLKTSSGVLYQKSMYFLYAGNRWEQFLLALSDRPVSIVENIIFP